MLEQSDRRTLNMVTGTLPTLRKHPSGDPKSPYLWIDPLPPKRQSGCPRHTKLQVSGMRITNIRLPNDNGFQKENYMETSVQTPASQHRIRRRNQQNTQTSRKTTSHREAGGMGEAFRMIMCATMGLTSRNHQDIRNGWLPQVPEISN